MLLQALLASAVLPLFVLAQDDGSISGPTSSSEAAGYSCDTSKCQLPSCNCASPNPPGGLSPVRRILFTGRRSTSCHLSTKKLTIFFPVGHSSVYRFYRGRCHPVLHFGCRQPVPCKQEEPQWLPTEDDILHFHPIHELHSRY